MVSRFRRTVSFPNSNQSRPSKPSLKSYHTRSTSLPYGSHHPLIPHLRFHLQNLLSWADSSSFPPLGRPTSAHFLTGLDLLKSLLDSLDDTLQLPQTLDSLSSHVFEKLLEDFLRFVDAFGIFQTSMLNLKLDLSAAQVALRRNDAAKISLYIKTQREIVTQIQHLVSTVRSINPIPQSDGSDEISTVIRDVHDLTASVSATVFNGAATSFSGSNRRRRWMRLGQNGGVKGEFEMREIEKWKKGDEEKRMRVLKKMEELEECIGEMEVRSERVLRRLISTRVSLLNILNT